MYEQRMQKYPLFISYSRTGCHWINCVMELYFDRPRLREQRVTLLDSKRKDYMWFHDHDYELNIPEHNDVLYLYRNPVPTVYSNLMYKRFENNRNKDSYKNINFKEERVLKETNRYNKNLRKWLLGDYKARTYVRHESFVKDPVTEFKKVVDHFDKQWNCAKAKKCFEKVTKKAILNAEQVYAPAMNQELLTENYKKNRKLFSDTWGHMINEVVLTEDLKSYFGD